ncbi:hypothetical protein J4465_02030 [Candidatus Pacearchaeota archaeon]|nr:hypothetical protein [Candidatus Pacearchaeota archaeon]
MSQKDLVCVVSADVPTTHLRIEKALQRFHDSRADLFVLNGFNDSTKHDSNFKGETWRDDDRLKDIYKDLENLNKVILYARNTVENGVELRKVMNYSQYRSGEVITSDTHFIRLVRTFYSVFPEEEFNNLSFSRCREPSKKLTVIRTISEALEYPFTEAMLVGIKNGDSKIAEIYNQRRYHGKIGKALSSLKAIIS